MSAGLTHGCPPMRRGQEQCPSLSAAALLGVKKEAFYLSGASGLPVKEEGHWNSLRNQPSDFPRLDQGPTQ